MSGMQNIICPTPDGGYLIGICGKVVKVDADAVTYAECMARAEVTAEEVSGMNYFTPFSVRVTDRLEQFLVHAAENKISEDEEEEVRWVNPDLLRIWSKALWNKSSILTLPCS